MCELFKLQKNLFRLLCQNYVYGEPSEERDEEDCLRDLNSLQQTCKTVYGHVNWVFLRKVPKGRAALFKSLLLLSSHLLFRRFEFQGV